MDENKLNDIMKVVKHIDLNKQVVESDNELESDTGDVLPEVADSDVVMEEVTDSHNTPRATLYEHNETPEGSIYWEPHVHGIPKPVEGTYFDTLDEAIDMYTNYAEIRATTNKIGATRAHNLLSSMKGGYEYVHGTTDDFKNHQRDVNVFIGESDAQMLINKMENRKMYVPNFTFQYKVENSEFVAMFWADEVAKCNYKEFGDIVSFDATFNSNN
ncbi:FAR1-related sequence 5-like protein [Tanacetum coccineum]